MHLIRYIGSICCFLCAGVTASTTTKIISLAPFLTDWVHDFSLDTQLIAVSSACDNRNNLPTVSQAGFINIEALARLDPDIILAWDIQKPLLREYPYPERIHYFTVNRLDDFPRFLYAIGKLLGNEHKAKLFVDEWAQIVIDSRNIRRRKLVPMAYVASIQPLFILGGRSLIGDAMRFCGYTNPFGLEESLAKQISLEAWHRSESKCIFSEKMKKNNVYFNINSNCIAHPNGWLERPNHQFFLGLQWLCEQYIADE